jgi:shikimate dehydrogenase
MPVAAVLGWPLTHTLSPPLHNAAYRAAGLVGWRYEARPTPPADLAGAIGELREGRLAGANLTTPHKRAAVPMLDRLEDLAAELGAVNTVSTDPADGALVGANTDVPGALWAMGTELGLAGDGWDGGGPAVLLGTGGVALAVARAWRLLTRARTAAGLATAPLTVVGRDPGRAEAVAALAGPGSTAVPFARAAEMVAGARVMVQATTLTAAGDPVPGQERLGSGGFVLDLNYGPKAAVLVDAARAAGAVAAVDGLGMLIAQAAEAVTRHTGATPDLGAMAAAVGRSWPAGPVGGQAASRR